MVFASLLQIVGLGLDIIGFCFLIREVGFSHRLEILSNPEKPIEAPDIDSLKLEADSHRDAKLKKLAEIKKQKHSAWKLRLGEAIINWQIARRYARIEREKRSYEERKKLGSLSRADAILKRRMVLFKGASLVILGFSLQLVGAVIGLFNINP